MAQTTFGGLAAVRLTMLVLSGCYCGSLTDTEQLIFVNESDAEEMLADGEVSPAECEAYCAEHSVLLSHTGCSVAQAPDTGDTGDRTELSLSCAGTTTVECE